MIFYDSNVIKSKSETLTNPCCFRIWKQKIDAEDCLRCCSFQNFALLLVSPKRCVRTSGTYLLLIYYYFIWKPNISNLFVIFLYLNYRTMRDMAQYTKIAPAGRIDRLLNFNQRLSQTPASAQHLTDWSLSLEPKLVQIPARILPYPQIMFGANKKWVFLIHNYCFQYQLNNFFFIIFLRVKTDERADWQSEFRNNAMACCVDLKRWYVITPSRCRKEAEDFVKALQRAGNGMKFTIANPRL